MNCEQRLGELRLALGLDPMPTEGEPSIASTLDPTGNTLRNKSAIKSVGFASPISISGPDHPRVSTSHSTVSKIPNSGASKALVPLPGPRFASQLETVLVILKTPVALGILTFVLVFVILLFSKPGFLGSDVIDDQGSSARKSNVNACFWIAAICGSLVICLPYIVRWRMLQAATQAGQSMSTF